MLMQFRFAVFLIFLLAAHSLLAQGQTFTQAQINDFVKSLTAELVGRQVSAVHAGTTNLSTAAASGTNRDYSSPLLAAFESFAKSKGESISFEGNFDVGERHGGKIQFVFKKPDISTQLQKALASNTSALEALRGELTHEDDISVTLSISPLAAKGEKQAQAMFQSYALPVFTRTYEVLNAMSGGSTNPMTAASAGFLSATLGLSPEQSITREMVEEALMQLLEPVAEKLAAVEEGRSKWTIDGVYHSRHETVGPDDASLKVRFELGFAPTATEELTQGSTNLAAACAQKIQELTFDSTCGNEILSALERAANDPQAKKQERLVFALEARSQEANDILLPQYTIDLKNKRAHSVIGAITYGRDVRVQNDLAQRGRVDLELKYEEVTDDPLRDDRFVGSVTYTQRISETLQIPISLIYANHADYLTNVDRRLNAHFGISYKLP
jgi:hypothetical protein